MKKIAVISLALLLGACAHKLEPETRSPAVTRAAKPGAKPAVVAAPATPNQAVKKRWFPKFKIKWLYSK